LMAEKKNSGRIGVMELDFCVIGEHLPSIAISPRNYTEAHKSIYFVQMMHWSDS
jgi:hypothetical protein